MKEFSISRGFTLIELMIVFAIFITATSVGMASFSRYSTTQILNNTQTEIVTVLNNAKINAVTQTLLNPCTYLFKKYSIKFIIPDRYEMWAYCNGGSYPIKNQLLPKGITFDAGTVGEVSFLIGSGISSGGIIKLKDSNITKTIDIDSTGNITGQ